jgi:hypothetical protein
MHVLLTFMMAIEIATPIENIINLCKKILFLLPTLLPNERPHLTMEPYVHPDR